MNNTIKDLLIDLDGTLIQFDLNTFIRNYLYLIQNSFSNLSFAKYVPEWVLGGTDAMLNSVETITNKDKFLNYFQEKSGLSESEIWEIFLHFYNTDYNQLRGITQPVEGAKSFLEAAVSNKFNLVLATQPVFPEIAIRKRLSWAGLENIPFKMITHIENMYACKPHREYFDQILKMPGIRNNGCMMIGNDLEMDMAAKNSGIETFFLQTHPGDSQVKIKNADYTGNFEQLSSILDLKL
jgi:FMN phosphatase YigB (HAD superfamily)